MKDHQLVWDEITGVAKATAVRATKTARGVFITVFILTRFEGSQGWAPKD